MFKLSSLIIELCYWAFGLFHFDLDLYVGSLDIALGLVTLLLKELWVFLLFFIIMVLIIAENKKGKLEVDRVFEDMTCVVKVELDVIKRTKK